MGWKKRTTDGMKVSHYYILRMQSRYTVAVAAAWEDENREFFVDETIR